MAEKADASGSPSPPAKTSLFKKILVTLALLIAVFLVVVALQPPKYHVERSIKIDAPAEVVFDQVNDLHKWRAWSPWEKKDPNMTRTYDGPESGDGAQYSWKGNAEVGEGRMTITKSDPNALIAIKLDFFKPFEGTSVAEFTFKPEGDGTAVRWSIDGEKNFISKAICLFMNMDQMIGKDFEQGLADLKAVSEKDAKK